TFTFGGIELVSRLVDGAYPDYQQIIPQQTPTKVVVATRELNTATKGASLFARSGIFDIMLDVKPDQKEVEISATSGQLGQNTTKLDAVITGEGNSIALNYRYLLDGLQNIASEQVELGIIDASSPCLITPNTKGAEYLYLIMPIKQ
ncbi:MAG TPA: DNA polymerase III subunit beta, partial [Candidatus Saccharimonadales bacterium]